MEAAKLSHYILNDMDRGSLGPVCSLFKLRAMYFLDGRKLNIDNFRKYSLTLPLGQFLPQVIQTILVLISEIGLKQHQQYTRLQKS